MICPGLVSKLLGDVGLIEGPGDNIGVAHHHGLCHLGISSGFGGEEDISQHNEVLLRSLRLEGQLEKKSRPSVKAAFRWLGFPLFVSCKLKLHKKRIQICPKLFVLICMLVRVPIFRLRGSLKLP